MRQKERFLPHKIPTCKDNKIFGVWGAWGEIGKFGKQLFSSSPCTSCTPCTLYPVPLVPKFILASGITRFPGSFQQHTPKVLWQCQAG